MCFGRGGGGVSFCVCSSPLQRCEIGPCCEGNSVKTVKDDSIVNSQIKELHLSSICRRTWLRGNVSRHVTALKPANGFFVGLFRKINPTPA